MSSVVFLSGQLSTNLLWDGLRLRNEPALTLQKYPSMRELAENTLGETPPQFQLVAHGMAGFASFEILRQQPERVEKLVLISTLAQADTPSQTQRRQGYLQLVEQGRFDHVIEERIPMLVHPDRRGDVTLTGALRRMARDTGSAAFLNQQRAIMTRTDSRPGLGAIGCPVLLIFGAADGITSLEHQHEMLRAIPNAGLEIIADSGHMVPLERAAKTNALIRAFLAP